MPIDVVPMSTDVAGGGGGGDQAALVQALLQRQQRQTAGAANLAAAQRPQAVYNNGVGMMMLANGALGGFLDAREQAQQQALARQGAEGAAQLAGSMGLSPQQTQAMRAILLSNPQAASGIMQALTQRMSAAPSVHEGIGPNGETVQRVWDPMTRQWTQQGGARIQTESVAPGASVIAPQLAVRGITPGQPQGAPQGGGAAPGGAAPGGAPAPAGGPPGRPGMVFQSPGFRPVDGPLRQQLVAQGVIQPTDQRPYQIGPDGQLHVVPDTPNNQVTTSVNTATNPIVQGFGEQFAQQRTQAASAADAVRAIHTARRQLDEPGGVITGMFANGRMDMARLGSFLGITDPAALRNTQAFQAAVGQQVLATIRGFGANPSNAEREFSERIAGGNTALDEAAIRRILDIQENHARQAIDRYNGTAQRVFDELRNTPGVDQQGLAITRILGPVQMPEPYTAPQGAIGPPPNPNAPAPQAAPQAAPPQAAAPPQGMPSLQDIETEILRRQQGQQ